MVNFEDFNITQLRKIVRAYKLHYSIPKFTKLNRDELITEMKKHLKIENDMIKSIQSTFSQEIPKKKIRQPRQRKARTSRKKAQPQKENLQEDDELNLDDFTQKDYYEFSKKSSLTEGDLDEDYMTFGNLKDFQKKKLREIETKFKIDFNQYTAIHNNGEKYVPCIFFFKNVDLNIGDKKFSSVELYSALGDKIRNLVGEDDLTGFKKIGPDDYKYFSYDNDDFDYKKVYMLTILFKQKLYTSELIKLSSPTELIDFKTPDIDKLNNIGEFLLNEMGNDNQKIFICHNKKNVDNELNNNLESLGDLLKYNDLSQIWGRGTFNIAKGIGNFDLDMYNITKEQGKIVLRSIACISIREPIDYMKELYIDYLSGSKYTFRIFEYINNIINNKKGIDKYNSINWKDIKYLSLSAIASFNTLYFYQKQNMEISLEENNEIIEYLKNTFESYYSGKHYNEQLKLFKDALKEPINTKKIEELYHRLSDELPHLYLFFKLKDTKKTRKNIETEIESKLIPFNIIKDLKEASENLSGSGINEKLKSNSKYMFSFKDLSHSHLKRIASYYNKHIGIKGISKMKKDELVSALEKHLFINENGDIKLKDHSDTKIPKNPKTPTEELKTDIRSTKKLIKTLEKFNQLQKTKESEDLLKLNKEKLEEFEDKLKSKSKGKKEEPKITNLDEFPKSFKEYIEVLREIKKYSIKFFGTKEKPNPKYEEFEKKRLEITKDLDGIEDLNKKDNRLFFNKMKKKYGVKYDGELIRLYKHFEYGPDESYIKDNYNKDFSKWLDLLKEFRNLRHEIYNLYGDFKEGHNYVDKILKEENLKDTDLTGYGKKNSNNGYALHTVLVNKTIPFEQAFKEAQAIIKKKKFFHRETKNQYRFRNIPKQKFEPKTFRSKKINKDTTLVFGKLKPEHMHLEGAGLFDWVKEKASAIGSKVKEFFSPRLDNYNNKSKKTIEQYGNIPVKQLFISRTPVGGMLNNLINFISLGKWEELKKKYAFDKLFHLSLVARLSNGKDIILEKNEVVNISPDYKVYKDTESLDIPFSGELTINKILETARQNVGDRTFFDYDAFKNNCQFFIKYLLEGQGLYSQQAKDFLFQDLESIYKDLPEYVPYIMKGATRLGNIVNKITGGEKPIVMQPEDFIREHKKLIGLLRQYDDPKLLAEADEQAKELKMKTGVDLTKKLEGGAGNRDFIKNVMTKFGQHFKEWSRSIYKDYEKGSELYNLHKSIFGLTDDDDSFELIDKAIYKTPSQLYVKDILSRITSLPTRTLAQRFTGTRDVGVAEQKLDLTSMAIQRFREIITNCDAKIYYRINEGTKPHYVKETLSYYLDYEIRLYPEAERAKAKAEDVEIAVRVDNPLNKARLATLERDRAIATASPAGATKSETLSNLEKREANIKGLPKPVTRYDRTSSMIATAEAERAEREAKEAKTKRELDEAFARMGLPASTGEREAKDTKTKRELDEAFARMSKPAGTGLGRKKSKKYN